MEKSKDYWVGYTDALREWHNISNDAIRELCEYVKSELEKGEKYVERKRVGGKYRVQGKGN